MEICLLQSSITCITGKIYETAVEYVTFLPEMPFMCTQVLAASPCFYSETQRSAASDGRIITTRFRLA